MNDGNTRQYTIMIVDDVEADIDILVECLSDSYRVKAAIESAAALEDIKADPPDVVLLDIMMPDMDGYEVCRQIKGNPETKDVLVIFVTALTEEVDETRGFRAGAVDYITKPFSFAVIHARIKTHLELADSKRKIQKQNEILVENIKLREQFDQVTRHDLKNPLTVVLGAAHLLEVEIPDKNTEIHELIQDQVKACYQILNMINRSLDLYKIENNSYLLNTQRIDILPLIHQIFTGAEKLMTQKDIIISVDINGRPADRGDPFHIRCDALLFYSMMSNLIMNAIEASPKRGWVKISLNKNNEVLNKNILIHIENQGRVPPHIRDRFFDKFITAGKPEGTGLGTYSARLTADIHGGGIRLVSLDERNTTQITVTLPNDIVEN